MCRLQAYANEYEDDVKDLQQRDLTPQQRLAAQVRSLPRRCVNCAAGRRCCGGQITGASAQWPVLRPL